MYEAARFPGQPGMVWVGEGKTDEDRQWKPLSECEEHLPEVWRHPPEEALKAGHGGGDYFEVRDFVEAVLSGAPPPIDLYTALEWTAAGLCSQISIQNNGVPIRVPDFRNSDERPAILDSPPVVL
ncbi:MAG: hypothetical protein KY468_05305 [Armatimonadetes bacterium]|nr:hypothetical protein [Armatimonadota bacterium]